VTNNDTRTVDLTFLEEPVILLFHDEGQAMIIVWPAFGDGEPEATWAADEPATTWLD
jgi:hypothetical protein